MSFNDLNETFNVDGEVVVPEVSPIKPKKITAQVDDIKKDYEYCLLYTSPSPRDRTRSRMPSSA